MSSSSSSNSNGGGGMTTGEVQYELLRQKCEQLNTELLTMRREHANLLNKLGKAVSDGDIYRCNNARLHASLQQLRSEMKTLTATNHELSSNKTQLEREVQTLTTRQSRVAEPNGGDTLGEDPLSPQSAHAGGGRPTSPPGEYLGAGGSQPTSPSFPTSPAAVSASSSMSPQGANGGGSLYSFGNVYPPASLVERHASLQKDHEELNRKYQELLSGRGEDTSNRDLSVLRRQFAEQTVELAEAKKDTASLKKQCTAAILEWNDHQRENSQLKAKLERTQFQMLNKDKELQGLYAERQEVRLVMSERDHVLKEMEQLQDKIAEYKQIIQQISENRSERLLPEDEDFASQIFGDCATSSSQEMEGLRRDLDRLRHELSEAKEETGAAKKLCDWAFIERDKMVLEGTSIRKQCDELRRERDRAVSEHVEVLRELDELKKKHRATQKDIQELRDSMTTQMERKQHLVCSSNSRDSAIDMEMSDSECETLTIDLEYDRFEDLGFHLEGGDPSSDAPIYISHVAVGKASYGQLRMYDVLLGVNTVDVSRGSREVAITEIRGSQGHVSLKVKRKKYLDQYVVTANLSLSRKDRIWLETGVFITKIESSSSVDCLSVGDRVLAVNNKHVNVKNGDLRKSPKEVMKWIHGSPDSQVAIKVVKGGVSSENVVVAPTANSGQQQQQQQQQLPSTTSSATMDNRGSRGGALASVKKVARRGFAWASSGGSRGDSSSGGDTSDDATTLVTAGGYPAYPVKSPNMDTPPSMAAALSTWPRQGGSYNTHTLTNSKGKDRMRIPSAWVQGEVYRQSASLSNGSASSSVDPDNAHTPTPSTISDMGLEPGPGGTFGRAAGAVGQIRTLPTSLPLRPNTTPTGYSQRNSGSLSTSFTSPGLAPYGGSCGGVSPYPSMASPSVVSGAASPATTPGSVSSSLTASLVGIGDGMSPHGGGGGFARPERDPADLDKNLANYYKNRKIYQAKPRVSRRPSSPGYHLNSSGSSQFNFGTAPVRPRTYHPISGATHSVVTPNPSSSSTSSSASFSSVSMAPPSYQPQPGFPPIGSSGGGGPRNPSIPELQGETGLKVHHGYMYPSFSHSEGIEWSDDRFMTLRYMPSSSNNSLSFPRKVERVKFPSKNSIHQTSTSSIDRGSSSDRSSPTSPIVEIVTGAVAPGGAMALGTRTGYHHHHAGASISGALLGSVGSASGTPTPASKSHTLPKKSRPKPKEGETRSLVVQSQPLGITIDECRPIGVFISSVTDHGHAYEAGVFEGDNILEVAGINFRGKDRGIGLCSQVLNYSSTPLLIKVQYNPGKRRLDGLTLAGGTDPALPQRGHSSETLPGATSSSASPRKSSRGPSKDSNSSTDGGGAQTPAAEQKRLVCLQRSLSSTCLRLIGGNATGVYVSHVREDSPAHAVLKPGDRILEINGVDMTHNILEAAAIELQRPVTTETIKIQALHSMADYTKLKSQLTSSGGGGDSFYVRAQCRHQPSIIASSAVSPSSSSSGDSGSCGTGLGYSTGDILLVENSLYAGRIGQWWATKVSDSGERGASGVIPSRIRMEESTHTLQRSFSETLQESGSSAGGGGSSGGDNEQRSSKRSLLGMRGSFLKRKTKKSSSTSSGGGGGLSTTHQRSSSHDSRELTSFSDLSPTTMSSSEAALSLSAGDFGEGTLVPYQKIERIECKNPRPVLLIGPLAEKMVQKMHAESNEKYVPCRPENVRMTSVDMHRSLTEGVFVDSQKKGDGTFDAIRAATIEQICSENHHCMIVANPASVEKMHRMKICPIVIFVKFKGVKQLKEVKDPNVLPGNMSTKYCKEMFERYHAEEHDFRSSFTVVVEGSTIMASIINRIKQAIDAEQKKIVWLSTIN